MNAFGDAAEHTIVSAMPDQLGARDAIDPGIKCEIAQDPPPLTGRPSVEPLQAIARYMRRFDLVLTYNWGAIDGGDGARACSARALPPLVHHEDGFNADEAGQPQAGAQHVSAGSRCPRAHALVVPSRTLERIALEHLAPAARRACAGSQRHPARCSMPGKPDAQR